MESTRSGEKKRIRLNLDAELVEAVKVIALGNGVTASEIINRILNNNREIKMIKSAIKIEAESESGVFAVPGPKSKLRKDK